MRQQRVMQECCLRLAYPPMVVAECPEDALPAMTLIMLLQRTPCIDSVSYSNVAFVLHTLMVVAENPENVLPAMVSIDMLAPVTPRPMQ